MSGSLRVAKTAAAGKETILRTLSQGDMFAAPALLGNAIAPATVRAETFDIFNLPRFLKL